MSGLHSVWSKDSFDQTGETPQQAILDVELDEIAAKYADDWLVGLFHPFGMREILEKQVFVLMDNLSQSYDSVMSMPASRRQRFLEYLAERSRNRKAGK